MLSSPTQTWSDCRIVIMTPQYTAGFIEASRIVVDVDYFIAYGVR